MKKKAISVELGIVQEKSDGEVMRHVATQAVKFAY